MKREKSSRNLRVRLDFHTLPHLYKNKNKNKNPGDYINRKEYHSIVLQGLVDNRYLFRDIFVGWTGKSHDARIF